MDAHSEPGTAPVETAEASAAGVPPGPTEALGRFDRSFFVRMTLSFLVFLVAVALVEAGLRFGFELYAFYQADASGTRVAAERLAEDVRSIMLNQGGPVASRTVYPILRRNHELAGLLVAVEPSEVTRTSVLQNFDFQPRGIPADWPPGTHHEARVEIRAEEFCLRCHSGARVGDVLGTVTARTYLDMRLDRWWEGLRLTVTVNVVKIVVNVAMLFFLLRTLLAPLLSLRSAVSSLSRGSGGLSARAPVRSADEFGELAHDLNAFLDRVEGILADLRATVTRMVAVSTRLARVSGEGQEAVERMVRSLRASLPGPEEPARSLSEDDLDRLIRALDALMWRLDPEDAEGAARVARLQVRLDQARSEWDRLSRLQAHLPALVDQAHELRHVVGEVALLEEQLNDVTEAGNRLLDRLMVPDEAAESQEPGATPGSPTTGDGPVVDAAPAASETPSG